MECWFCEGFGCVFHFNCVGYNLSYIWWISTRFGLFWRLGVKLSNKYLHVCLALVNRKILAFEVMSLWSRFFWNFVKVSMNLRRILFTKINFFYRIWFFRWKGAYSFENRKNLIKNWQLNLNRNSTKVEHVRIGNINLWWQTWNKLGLFFFFFYLFCFLWEGNWCFFCHFYG